ncbi:MAG: class I SAM-dependent methyltransferase [Pyrinomonadaceae bacterium]
MKAEEAIKEYWDERARAHAGSPRATTDDIYLRELELATLTETLKSLDLPAAATVLDVGCGDGYTTLAIAERLPALSFSGVDYSAQMIENARQQLAERAEDLQARVAFSVGDATNLATACGDELFDVTLTDRCLINLPSLERQAEAIAQIAAHTKPGGYYVAIENFVEGQENMNAMRRSVGVPEIPIRWHNLFFREADLVAAAAPFFDQITFKDFSSSYYFATRVIYSAMCQMRGEQPDYEHEIHQLAVKLPWMGQFSPIRMVVLRRKQ